MQTTAKPTRPGAGQERFEARFQVERADPAARTFSGYASVFGSRVDTWPPTVIEPGAFTDTLRDDVGRVRILYQHDVHEPIGRPLEAVEDARGLWLTGQLSDTARGREVFTLLEDGVVRELSIGFDPVRWTLQADPLAPHDPERQVRHLQAVRLWEISLVTFAADPLAQIVSVPGRPRWEAEAEVALARSRRREVMQALVALELAALEVGARAVGVRP